MPESHLRFEPVVLNGPYTSVLLNTLQITFIHLEHVFLPGESHGQSSLAGSSPQDCKESDTTERLTGQMQRTLSQEVPRVHLHCFFSSAPLLSPSGPNIYCIPGTMLGSFS